VKPPLPLRLRTDEARTSAFACRIFSASTSRGMHAGCSLLLYPDSLCENIVAPFSRTSFHPAGIAAAETPTRSMICPSAPASREMASSYVLTLTKVPAVSVELIA